MRDVLHWLPISHRIQYRITAQVSRCVLRCAPSYLRDLCCPVSGLAARRVLQFIHALTVVTREESISLLPACRSYQLMIELYNSGVKLLCQEIFACLTLWTRVTYFLYYFVLTITSSFV